jgi:hypothetical protein
VRRTLIAAFVVFAAVGAATTQTVFAQRIGVPVPDGVFSLEDGNEPVCAAIAQRIQEARVSEHMCGLPPLDPAAFSSPHWVTLDAAQNMGLVRELVALSHIAEAPAFRLAYAERRLATFDAQESLELLWRVYGQDVEGAVHETRFRLQRASVDADNDGENETIYRFTQYPGTCASADPAASGSEAWTYQMLLRDDRRLALHYGAVPVRADFFVYEGRTYRFDFRSLGAEVIDPQILLDNRRHAPLEIGDRPVCYFRTGVRIE